MHILYILILAFVQGLAELLPVSSSAHVVVVEKLLGLDPSSPAMTLLLVMLHTGTMFAVIVYFWSQWRDAYFQSTGAFKKFAGFVVVATAPHLAIRSGSLCERWALASDRYVSRGLASLSWWESGPTGLSSDAPDARANLRPSSTPAALAERIPGPRHELQTPANRYAGAALPPHRGRHLPLACIGPANVPPVLHPSRTPTVLRKVLCPTMRTAALRQ